MSDGREVWAAPTSGCCALRPFSPAEFGMGWASERDRRSELSGGDLLMLNHRLMFFEGGASELVPIQALMISSGTMRSLSDGIREAAD